LDLNGQIKLGDLPHLEEEVFDLLKVSLSEITKPGELLKNEILQEFNRENFYQILKDIHNFIVENKEYFNKIVCEKKGRLMFSPSNT